MGLNVFANVDPVALFTGGNYPTTGGFIKAANGPAVEWYYDRLDFFAAKWSSGLSSAGDYLRWDPLLTSNVGLLFDEVSEPGNIGGSNAFNIAVGEWDRGANTQRVYNFVTSTNQPFNELQPLALNQVISADPFPAVGSLQHRGSLISTDIGFYDQAGAAANGWVFFETWGYALATSCRVRHSDGNLYTDVPALVRLSDGFAAILQGVYTDYNSAPNAFQQHQLFGQNVALERVQFVPDDISTPAAPRGRLFLFSRMAENPNATTFFRPWVAVYDWNPLNVSGTPSRVHLRLRLLTAVDLLKSTPASLNGVHEGGTSVAQFMHYHPRTNRLMIYSSQAAGPQLDAAESKFLLISSTPVVAELSDPSPLQEVATGKTVSFAVEALGSLAEKIGGVAVDFALTRVSSVDEVLTIVPSTPGQTVAVANGPISPTDPNLSPVVVKKDGTPLTETTHYTLNRAAGQITFVAPEPVDGSVYTATYRHFATPAAPPHGSPQNLTAVTDVTGAAICRVEYAAEDPVPDRWDRLEATEA